VVTYWFPKFSGRLMSEVWGKVAFALVFVGFHVAFFPMHIVGMMGMPRRVYTYPGGMGWGTLNAISTIGAFVLAIGFVTFMVNALVSLRRGTVAGADPWAAPGLEWATSSPPPVYNFPHIPTVASRTPLWEGADGLAVMSGLRVDEREHLLTTVIDAIPSVREPSPNPTVWPFLSAVAVGITFVASIFTPWALVIGLLPAGIALTIWFWPKNPEVPPEPVIE
jgi:cytochrome c oxidase subunit 1